jgi:hypothetical protein
MELTNFNFGEEAKQRSDIQLWVEITKKEDIISTNNLFKIEIAIPLRKQNGEEESSNSIQKRINFKIKKYSPLIITIRNRVEKNQEKQKF